MVPVDQQVVHVLVLGVLVDQVLLDLLPAHGIQSFQFGLDYVFANSIEVSVVEIQGSELIRRLKDERNFRVINFIPKHDAVQKLHQVVLHMEAVPTLLRAVVLQSEVLHIEKLAAARVGVDGLKVLPRISPLRLDQDFLEIPLLVGRFLFYQQVEGLLFFLVDDVLGVLVFVRIELDHFVSQTILLRFLLCWRLV